MFPRRAGAEMFPRRPGAQMFPRRPGITQMFPRRPCAAGMFPRRPDAEMFLGTLLHVVAQGARACLLVRKLRLISHPFYNPRASILTLTSAQPTFETPLLQS